MGRFFIIIFLVSTVGYAQDKVINQYTNKKGKKITLIRPAEINVTTKNNANNVVVKKVVPVKNARTDAPINKTNEVKKKLVITSGITNKSIITKDEVAVELEKETESKSELMKRESLEAKKRTIKKTDN